jgi:uroporphyrinogen decarboxylase
MIGTGKNLERTRAFAADQPEVWERLLERVAAATSRFIRPLLAEGAVAWQLFDSWAGQLTREEYRRWSLPWHQKIFAETGGRSLLFVKDCPYLDERLDSGATGLSLCLADDLTAIRKLRPNMPLQGNVDHMLLVNGTEAEVAAATRACLTQGGGRGHILNLDHGMDRAAKPELFATYVETARSWRAE